MTDKFVRIRQLGRGGMATVFLCRERATSNLVAVKVLNPEIRDDHEYVRRFFREAGLVARLQHPNIIRVLASDFSGGEYYIVTEYIDGGDFKALLAEPAVTPAEKLGIMVKVVGALDYAHQRGVVHRDVKPSNILLNREREPKLCDFGIATDIWGASTQLTRTSEVMGTMDYIAPEQKESAKNVDYRADIYSVGVILYQCLTGIKPQGAFRPPAAVVPGLPRQLDAVVMKCLQPRVEDRYKSTMNLWTELQDALRLLTSGAALVVPPAASEDTDRTTVDPAAFETVVRTLNDAPLTEKIRLKNRFQDIVAERHRPRLMELLAASDGLLLESVIEALGRLKAREACPRLIELLQDPRICKAAAQALGEIGCPTAATPLLDLLRSGGELAHVALIPLGKLKEAKALPWMKQFLRSNYKWVREAALEALAALDHPDAADGIAAVAERDPDADVRAKAKTILWRWKK